MRYLIETTYSTTEAARVLADRIQGEGVTRIDFGWLQGQPVESVLVTVVEAGGVASVTSCHLNIDRNQREEEVRQVLNAATLAQQRGCQVHLHQRKLPPVDLDVDGSAADLIAGLRISPSEPISPEALVDFLAISWSGARDDYASWRSGTWLWDRVDAYPVVDWPRYEAIQPQGEL